MNHHITVLRRTVARKLQDLVDNIYCDRLEPYVKFEFRRDHSTSFSIQREFAVLRGSEKEIIRIFVETPTCGKYGSVGWVLEENLTHCMICASEFRGITDYDHCSACGNLICSLCWIDGYSVEYLESLGDVRVCKMCCWGQVGNILIFNKLIGIRLNYFVTQIDHK